jgi:hypothetical protein
VREGERNEGGRKEGATKETLKKGAAKKTAGVREACSGASSSDGMTAAVAALALAVDTAAEPISADR